MKGKARGKVGCKINMGHEKDMVAGWVGEGVSGLGGGVALVAEDSRTTGNSDAQNSNTYGILCAL